MRITYEVNLIRAIDAQREHIILHSRIERMFKRELLKWYDKEKERYEQWLRSHA